MERNKGYKKKNRKIMVQVGAAIVVLLLAAGIMISNMVTITSFSSYLTQLWYTNSKVIDDTVEALDNLPGAAWSFQYMKNHQDLLLLFKNGDSRLENIDVLYREFEDETGKYYWKITTEELNELSDELQEAAAILIYSDIATFFATCGIQYNLHEFFIVIPDEAAEVGTIFYCVGVDMKDGERIGEILNIHEMETNSERYGSALTGEVHKWGWKRPKDTDMFGIIEYHQLSDPETNFILYSTVDGKYVYDSMVFLNPIRRSINVLLIIVSILILLFLYRIVLKPLASLKQCVGMYQKHKSADKVERELSRIRSRNEIGVFADEFSSLTREMERYTTEVAALAGEKKRVETELHVATEIQTGMLPAVFPERSEFSLYALMEPAREVGGDFYDFYMLDDDHLVLTIADVSGKGIPGALFMAVSKAILKNRALIGGSPAEILADVNNQLCEGNTSEMFVTVWLGILTISSGVLICANAGHENPGMRLGVNPFSMIKTKHGFVLGGFEGIRFRDENYKLEPGDAIFVYTDGVPEATNKDNRMFGENRLEEILRRIDNEDTPQQMITTVYEAVKDFVGDAPSFDDMTMLALTYRG